MYDPFKDKYAALGKLLKGNQEVREFGNITNSKKETRMEGIWNTWA